MKNTLCCLLFLAFPCLIQAQSNMGTRERITVHSEALIYNLKQLDGIGMDVGDQDMGTASATRLHEILDKYGIVHEFEVYEGDHLNRIADRIRTRVLPFFSGHLELE